MPNLSPGLTLEPTGFTLHGSRSRLGQWLGRPRTEWQVLWSWIDEATGGKWDDLTIDTIFIELRVRGGRSITVHEEMDGWMGFLEAANAALPGFPDPRQWLTEVAQPPFARCVKTLYLRQEVRSRAG